MTESFLLSNFEKHTVSSYYLLNGMMDSDQFLCIVVVVFVFNVPPTAKVIWRREFFYVLYYFKTINV